MLLATSFAEETGSIQGELPSRTAPDRDAKGRGRVCVCADFLTEERVLRDMPAWTQEDKGLDGLS